MTAVPLNDDLLETAKRSEARLAEAERQSLLARADYHTAIRRLHLAGASLRDIAAALSLSHQRIQQIVEGSGGSWWRRAWRNRGTTRDAVCTWCGRPPGDVKKLVAGPKIYICDACVRDQSRALAQLQRPRSRLRGRTRCSFCGRNASAERSVVPGPHANVCDDCLTQCRKFMELDPV